VIGDAGDSITGLASGWILVEDAEPGYDSYTQGTAVVLVGVALPTDFVIPPDEE
jgi:hypothetical protein